MTTTTLTKQARTLIAAGSSNAAGAGNFTRGVADLRTSQGGLLTIKTTNVGALGVQAEVRVLIAHTANATPAPASAGVDWKTVYVLGTGIVSGTVNEWSYRVPSDVMHIEVEITGNTTSAVTCEAFLSETVSAVSV